MAEASGGALQPAKASWSSSGAQDNSPARHPSTEEEGSEWGAGEAWTEGATITSELDLVLAQRATITSELDLVLAQGRAGLFHVRAVGRFEERVPTVGLDKTPLMLVTACFLPVLVLRNLLPCPLRCSFLLAGDETPSGAYEAQSGEEVPIHEFGLEEKVSVGFSLPGLEESSEFVPIFCPEGQTLETHVTLFDANRDILRLRLGHRQAIHGGQYVWT
ncbi:hypothetical protein T484DRAFT_1773582 [Baffinella frigidus]|nr:hypothetical protein T484DRAFT_1773582 [Cryptophyta sp. CCMP2293]